MSDHPFHPPIDLRDLPEPGEQVQARLIELRAGQHQEQLEQLVGDCFEIPAARLFTQYPELREVTYRAVAEEIVNPTTTLTGNETFEAAMDILEAGYLRPGHPWTTLDQEHQGQQARAIARALTERATAEPARSEGTQPVTVYSAPHCQQCAATERSLTKAGVPFVKIDLAELDDAARARVVEGHSTAPVVHAPDVGVWSGHRPTQLEKVATQHAASVPDTGRGLAGPA
jgi:glutaredoxin-like protein NrdH